MQVFTQRVGERLVIADNIVVSVLAVYGDMVRLGVKAAPDVSVAHHGPKRLLRTQMERTAHGRFNIPDSYSDWPSAE
jgi:carbon storage regulator CsrA